MVVKKLREWLRERFFQKRTTKPPREELLKEEILSHLRSLENYAGISLEGKEEIARALLKEYRAARDLGDYGALLAGGSGAAGVLVSFLGTVSPFSIPAMVVGYTLGGIIRHTARAAFRRRLLEEVWRRLSREEKKRLVKYYLGSEVPENKLEEAFQHIKMDENVKPWMVTATTGLGGVAMGIAGILGHITAASATAGLSLAIPAVYALWKWRKKRQLTKD